MLVQFAQPSAPQLGIEESTFVIVFVPYPCNVTVIVPNPLKPVQKVTEDVGVPACVTVMFLVAPPPVTVIVADREEVDVLALALTLTDRLPVPEAGDTVSHDALPLLTVQLVLDVTENDFDPAL